MTRQILSAAGLVLIVAAGAALGSRGDWGLTLWAAVGVAVGVTVTALIRSIRSKRHVT